MADTWQEDEARFKRVATRRFHAVIDALNSARKCAGHGYVGDEQAWRDFFVRLDADVTRCKREAEDQVNLQRRRRPPTDEPPEAGAPAVRPDPPSDAGPGNSVRF